MTALTAVSLFSGVGGFCEGVRLAGWKVLCAVEADAQTCLTHAVNFQELALFRGDIANFLKTEQSGIPDLQQLKSRRSTLSMEAPLPGVQPDQSAQAERSAQPAV